MRHQHTPVDPCRPSQCLAFPLLFPLCLLFPLAQTCIVTKTPSTGLCFLLTVTSQILVGQISQLNKTQEKAGLKPPWPFSSL